ncbi:MAG: ribosome maturation factor [Saprospiraceae bacterium]|nr:ribosome maturation factor [Saprospiraceae bacterium]
MIEERIVELLDKKWEEPEWESCFVVEVKHHQKTNKLEVFIDSDAGMTFEKCQKISRYLESVLDVELWLGEKYVLEVSSPGVGRPLKLKRQYFKNIGRTLEVRWNEDNTTEGLLKEANELGISIEHEIQVVEGNKKHKQNILTFIPFEAIKSTKVKVVF